MTAVAIGAEMAMHHNRNVALGFLNDDLVCGGGNLVTFQYTVLPPGELHFFPWNISGSDTPLPPMPEESLAFGTVLELR